MSIMVSMISARLSPVWLRAPSRFAGLSRTRARAGLVLIALLIALCLTALVTPPPPAATGEGRATDQADDVTWKGSVVHVDHANGNKESSFDGRQQLGAALA